MKESHWLVLHLSVKYKLNWEEGKQTTMFFGLLFSISSINLF